MLRRVQQPARRPSSRERPRVGPWLLLFGVGLALRLLVVVVQGTHGGRAPAAAGELQDVASNLASGAGFSLSGPQGPVATAAVPPLVPWLASLTVNRNTSQRVSFLALQCVIGALIPLLIGMLGAAMFGASVGRVAAWLTTVSPVLVLPAATAGVSITFSACVLAALAATSSWVKTPRPARALGVGLILGLATLAHPAAALLPVIVAMWAWTPLGLTITGGDRTRQVALLFLGLAVAMAPWIARNGVAVRAPVLSTAVGRRLLEGNNTVAWNDRRRRGGGVDVTEVEPYRSGLRGRDALGNDPGHLDGSGSPLEVGRGATGRGPRGTNEADRDARAASLALHFLTSRLGEWPAVALAKVSRLWTAGALADHEPASEGGAPARATPASLVVRLWSLLLLPPALYGLVRTLFGPRRWFQALLGLVILAFVALAAVFYAAPTLRLPIEPLALLIAASGLEDARRRIRTRSHGLKVIEGRR